MEGRNAFYAVFFKIEIAHSQRKTSVATKAKGGQPDMRNQKYYIAIDEYERRIIINSLNNLRNRLIADGRYSDAIDEILVKFFKASIKKIKVKRKAD